MKKAFERWYQSLILWFSQWEEGANTRGASDRPLTTPPTDGQRRQRLPPFNNSPQRLKINLHRTQWYKKTNHINRHLPRFQTYWFLTLNRVLACVLFRMPQSTKLGFWSKESMLHYTNRVGFMKKGGINRWYCDFHNERRELMREAPQQIINNTSNGRRGQWRQKLPPFNNTATTRNKSTSDKMIQTN